MKEVLYQALAQSIADVTGLKTDTVTELLESPKNREFGDIAFPCFVLAKQFKKSPADCAQEIVEKIVLPEGIDTARPVGPFLNFSFSRAKFSEALIQQTLNSEPHKPRSEKVLVEYSSPNIAKPFHVGHLRATLIGNSLDRVYRYLGFKTVSVNHLGDWGTQFGFVWAGCELWGKPKEATVTSLVEIYRRATTLKSQQEKDEVPSDQSDLPDINQMARQYFVDLENQESYAVKFWQWCLDISLRYLKDTYARLDVSFDHYIGESFYSDKLDGVRSDLESAGVLTESEGAYGVALGEELGFARILTGDGRSLYLTRDIAAAKYRHEKFQFDRSIYVVGAPQTLHFNQLKAIFKSIKSAIADKIEHVAFGHVAGMSTRGGGGFIELNDFLDEAYNRSLSAYRDQVSKRPEGLDEQLVAQQVALAAIIFSNLSRSRLKDVQFSWDQELAFQGDTGPYLLYAYARINGIEQKALEEGVIASEDFDPGELEDDQAYFLVSRISEFEDVLERTISDNEPAYLAKYALDLAKDFSKSYNDLKVIGTEQKTANARLQLFRATRKTLGQTLELLGITPLERM